MFVVYNSTSLEMKKKAMEALGWHNGQHITKEQTYEAIAANATVFCDEQDALLNKGLPATDTKALREFLAS